MKGKIKVFVASLDINDHYVGTDKICKYCTPSHRTEIVAQQLKHSLGSSLFLSNDQREIVNMTHEFCKENNFEIEIVDITNLNLFEKIKLTLKGIKAPSISIEDNILEGKPTKEDLKAVAFRAPKS